MQTLTTSKATPSTRRAWLLFGALIAVSLILIFWLPRYFPLPRTYSDSYLFGYNNRVGVLLLLAALALVGIFSARLPLAFPAAGSTAPVSRRALRAWLLVFLLASFGLWLLIRGLGGVNESRYMIDRLEIFASGRRPYRDFEFAYGPLLLYAPRILMLAGLSAHHAYYLFWTLCTLTGVWMLAAVIDRLEIPGSHRTTVFHLFCLWLLPSLLGTGTNYSPLRFLAPILGALITARIAERIGPAGLAHWRVATATAATTAICLLFSPEMGIAFAIGVLAWLVFQLARSRRLFSAQGAAGIAALGASQALLLLGAGYLGEFTAVREFGDGAYNIPILPAGHILVFFFACGLVVVYLSWCLRHQRANSGLLLVAAVSTPLLMPALGRCDAGHVLFDGIGILLIATLLASSLRRLWQPYCAAFLLFIILLPAASGLLFYSLALDRVHVFSPRSVVRLSSAFQPARLFPGLHQVVDAPFGYYPANSGSWRSPAIDTGYYMMVMNAFLPQATQRKIAELRAHPERPLLLPLNMNMYCHIDAAAQAHAIAVSFVLPWRFTPRHNDDIWLPLCDYIHTHYQPAASSALPSVHYSLWTPTATTAPLPAPARH